MPTNPRSHRHPAAIEDSEDDYPSEDGRKHQIGQERMKQLALDILGRWHWLALGLILGILGGLYYLSKAPKVYQSRSTLLIKQRASSVMSNQDPMEELDLRSLDGMNTMADRITRLELLQKVASRPEVRSLTCLIPDKTHWLPQWTEPWFSKDLEENPSDSAEQTNPKALAEAIALWTRISVRRGTRLLDITVSHPSPEVARTVADAIGIEYQSELTGDRSTDRESTLKILVEESEVYRASLQTAQSAMGIYNSAIATLRDLEARESDIATLSRRYLPKHPRMVAAVAELKIHQRKFLDEFDAALNSSADRKYWDSHAAEWEKASGSDAERLAAARRLLLARGNVLESEIQSQSSVFNSILTRIQEADINEHAVESEVKISSAAKLPGTPVSPVAAKTMALASLLGLGIGALSAFLRARLDNKFHSVAQIAGETGVSVLGVVGEITDSELAAATRDGGHGPEQGVLAASRWNARLVFRSGMDATPHAEMFRSLRISVSLLGDEAERKITLFTSALPGEGKSLASANFALAAAAHGRKTLLVDLDLRRPTIHTLFGVNRGPDHCCISEVLAGQAYLEDAIVRNHDAPNLHLITAGRNPPNPGSLLASGRLKEFLARACEEFDVVVLDSAPLLAVTDTRMIAPLAHNLCLIARASQTPKGALRRAIELLDQDGLPLSGIVLNGLKKRRGALGCGDYGYEDRYSYAAYAAYSTGCESLEAARQ